MQRQHTTNLAIHFNPCRPIEWWCLVFLFYFSTTYNPHMYVGTDIPAPFFLCCCRRWAVQLIAMNFKDKVRAQNTLMRILSKWKSTDCGTGLHKSEEWLAKVSSIAYVLVCTIIMRSVKTVIPFPCSWPHYLLELSSLHKAKKAM